MDSFTERLIRDSSIRLASGGDTHFHPWSSGTGCTVTTRLPGGIEVHTQIRDRQIGASGENLTGFRYLFGEK
jgi:hypothetical protein